MVNRAPTIEFNCSAPVPGSRNPIPLTLKLHSHELAFYSKGASANISFQIPNCCIYGYSSVDCDDSARDQSVLIHYVEFTSLDLKAVNSPKLAKLNISFAQPSDAQKFHSLAKEVGVFPKFQRIQLLVNPKGGIGIAKRISDTVVKPMLQVSGLKYQEKYTEYGRHAVDIAHNIDLDDLDTLVVVSGDGVLHEVINGLLTRPDWDKARKLPIGIVPAGSGNAIATSIGTRSTIISTLALIRGQTAKLDIYSLSQHNRPRIYSMLLFSWGMMADSDIESERYRWLGALRFDIAGLVRMIKLRRYAGKIYALPPKHKPIQSNNSSSQDSPPTQYASLLTKTDEELPKPWRLLPNMPFYSMFAALNFPAAGENILFSNSIRMNDGVLRLFYSCETRARKIFLPFVLDTTNGKLLDSGLLQDEESSALLIIPGVEGNPNDPSTHDIVHPELVTSESARKLEIYKKPGVFDVDGEVMPTARTLVEVLPRFMNLVVPEWYYHYKDIDEEETEDDLREKKEEGKGRREKAILGKVHQALVLDTTTRRLATTGQSHAGTLLAIVAAVVALVAVALTNPEILGQGSRLIMSLKSSV